MRRIITYPSVDSTNAAAKKLALAGEGECAVTAAPDPIRGKVVKATVVLAKGWEPSDELVKELQNHVKKTTAPYKYPRIVEFTDELPKTIGGKIKRKLIRTNDGIED